MKKITVWFLLVANFAFSQDQAFQIFNKKGKKVTYKGMMKKSEDAQVVLFGELHNNPISHWLELEILKSLDKRSEIIFGTEMLERNDQFYLDEFINGTITFEMLDSLGDMWGNFQTDYLPLINYCIDSSIRVVATNIPRKYASMLYKKGESSLLELDDKEKSFIADLPLLYDSSLNCYAQMLEMMPGHANQNFPKAQAIKDATMSQSIVTALMIDPSFVFYHINGAYHSDNFESICWYLDQSDLKPSYITISTVTQSQLKKLNQENLGKADFIMVVDEDMTLTY